MHAAGSWQARTPGGRTSAQVARDWAAQQVTCPAGKISRRWLPCTDTWGNDGIVVQFARADCLRCAQREVCTRAKMAGRQLMLRPQEQPSALQAARAWQETADFKATYARRAGVEGSCTQANRRSDLRHARYIGRAKTHLQHILTAVAINLIRVLAWLAEVPRATTRTSPFAALMAQTPTGCHR